MRVPPGIRRIYPGLLAVLLVPVAALAAGPNWWMDWNVLRLDQGTQLPVQANDYAAVNQGQVKAIATAGVNELNKRLPRGAGVALNALSAQLSETTPNTNDYAPVNLGQIKHIAQPFYDRLFSVFYQAPPLSSGTYPWVGKQANDYAVANIGQVKNLFSFDLTATDSLHDTDGNGLPDWWERYHFGQIGADPGSLAQRGDGLSILQAFQQGLDPNDYYGGQLPALSIVSGNAQKGLPGTFLPARLVAKVSDAGGKTLQLAPVTFSAGGSGGKVSNDLVTLTNSLTVRSGTDGLASAYFQLPGENVAGTSTVVATATSGTQSAVANFQEIIEPFSTDGLQLWLKADAGTSTDSLGRVISWNDQSGMQNNAYSLSPEAVAGRATMVPSSLNGLPTIHMAGSHASTFSIAESPSLRPGNAVTLVSVLRPAAASFWTAWLLARDDYAYGIGSTPEISQFNGTVTVSGSASQFLYTGSGYTPAQPYLVADVYDGHAQTLYQSGIPYRVLH